MDKDLVGELLRDPRGTKFVRAEAPVVKLNMSTRTARETVIAKTSAIKKPGKRNQPDPQEDDEGYFSVHPNSSDRDDAYENVVQQPREHTVDIGKVELCYLCG